LPSDGDHGFHEKSSLFFALRTRISVKGHGCNLPFYFSMNRTPRQMGTGWNRQKLPIFNPSPAAFPAPVLSAGIKVSPPAQPEENTA
ncbi:MAG: hypothetical protein PUF98_02060, partial [Oscillibacter sp.]|nr:hypothetical protein [Oscillibacter sp.]